MNKYLFVCFTLIIFAGCTSVPIPSPQQNTLLAGKLLVNWIPSDKAKAGNTARNESVKTGIKIYIQDENTKKTTLLITQRGGWLISNKLNGNSYTIQKIVIEIRQDNTIWTITLSGPFNLNLENGAVNNIGTIQIDIENNKYSLRRIDYDTVKLDFQANFPDSEWNSYEWKNKNIFAKPK